MRTTRTGNMGVAMAPPTAQAGSPSAWSVPFGPLLGEACAPSDRDPTVSPREERIEREEEQRPHKAPAEVHLTLPSTPRGPREVERPAATAAPRPPDPPLQVIADQMLRGLCVNQVGSQTSLRMELSTPRLARIGIEMRVEGGRLSARLQVPDLAGREILRASASELAAGLGQRGIDVEAIQVDLEHEAANHGRSGTGDRDRHGRRRDRPRPRRDRRGGFVL